MKARMVRILALISLTLLSVVTEARTEAPVSGVYEGKITKSSFCDLSQGDKRICQHFTVQLGTGKVIEGSLWQGGTIYSAKGSILYKVDNETSSGEGWERFSKGVSYLKVGNNVRMTLSCTRFHCDINQINLK
jgi:hypothetical protein